MAVAGKAQRSSNLGWAKKEAVRPWEREGADTFRGGSTRPVKKMKLLIQGKTRCKNWSPQKKRMIHHGA